jgi:hypothetical protein
VRELLAEEVRHRAPLGLVLGRELGAMHGARVPGDRHPARRVVRQELEEHVGEAEERVRELPVGRLQLLREREERAVGEVVAVDEEELGLAGGPVVELQLLARQGLRHGLKVSGPGLGRPGPLSSDVAGWIGECAEFRSFPARGLSSSQPATTT